MKTNLFACSLFVGVFALLPARAPAQGLINGGFELYDRTTKFLPGWHAQVVGFLDYGTVVDGVSGSLLNFNYDKPESVFASVYGIVPAFDQLPIGNYWFFGRGPRVTLEQRFLVPATTRSLLFRAFNGFRGDGVTLQINGTVLDQHLEAIWEPGGKDGIVSDWAVDMTAYAGLEVDLRFSINVGGAGFDDVRVSTEVVPEPGAAALGMAGLSLLLLAGCQNTRRASNATHRIPSTSQFIP